MGRRNRKVVKRLYRLKKAEKAVFTALSY